MDKNRRNKKFSNWNNQRKENKNENRTNDSRTGETSKQKVFQFNKSAYENPEDLKEQQKAIQEIKSRQIICPKCNQPITDMASAFKDKNSDSPIHFECAMNEVSKQVDQTDKLGPNEKIAYIGQGRFGILFYENPRDQKHFTIKKIIEWEARDQVDSWREELSGVYSKVK